MHNPDTGGKLMVNFVTSTDPGSTCPFDSPNPGCTLTIPVLTPALTIVKTASAASATPGQHVTYTITVTDTGQTPYTGAVVTDDLTGLLDDAAYGADAAATRGAVSYASPVLTWTGNLTPGQAATITYYGHRRQPRDRRQHPHQHRHLGRPRQQLRHRIHRPPLRHHRPGSHLTIDSTARTCQHHHPGRQDRTTPPPLPTPGRPATTVPPSPTT